MAGRDWPPSPEFTAALDRLRILVRLQTLREDLALEAQLHDFLCSGAMPRDISLVQDYSPHRFDVNYMRVMPLRIK